MISCLQFLEQFLTNPHFLAQLTPPLLQQLLDEYPRIFIVGADNVRSKQMQQIRHSLRGIAEILMGKLFYNVLNYSSPCQTVYFTQSSNPLPLLIIMQLVNSAI